MGNVGGDSDFKSQLASEICSVATRIVACAHRRHHSAPITSPFIDWYRLLKVEEDAAADAIRKRFLKLALQLHPDKNAHPDAEIAFKLVSEGYACLSDDLKREAFDSDRRKKFCPDCKKIPFRDLSNSTPKLKPLNPPISGGGGFNNGGGLKNMRERLKEEASVIENCLRANSGATKETTSSVLSPTRNNGGCRFEQQYRETPVFNPCDYVCRGYPHFREQIQIQQSKTQSFGYVRSGKTFKYEYPVFEIRSEGGFLLKKGSAFVSSNRCQNAL